MERCAAKSVAQLLLIEPVELDHLCPISRLNVVSQDPGEDLEPVCAPDDDQVAVIDEVAHMTAKGRWK